MCSIIFDTVNFRKLWNVICLISLALITSGCKQEPKSSDDLNSTRFSTYCNPIDIDYTYSVVSTHRGFSYRSAADPAVVRHLGEFYLFSTRSQGYWHSKDLRSWEFVRPTRWFFESSNAPGAWSADTALLVLANPFGYMSLISANDPETGNWSAQPAIIPMELHDPDIFIDDDKRIYIYEGSSNLHPIQGVELDPKNYFLPKGEPIKFFKLNPDLHGWERFGESHNSLIDPFIEGPWMTKHNGKYYLQYAAPGTQWNVYGDGVYVADDPLGPFKYAPYNPVSYKPGGFVKGAGHGSTVRDNQGNYWHFGTSRISVNYLFERRLSMFPAGFEDNGQMYVNSAYGDYPQFLPEEKVESHKNRFSGWMLLSYNKPVKASSVLNDSILMNRHDESASGYMLPLDNINYNSSNVTDENLQTFWVANTNSDKEWLEIDLQDTVDVYASQINFQDFNSNIFGKPDTLFHQFLLEYSLDGINWNIAADYSNSQKDQPNCYIQFSNPITTQFIRYKNIHLPTPYLSISGFRVFGKGKGEKPFFPKYFTALIDKNDHRNAMARWGKVEDAIGYTLYWGLDPERLNNSVMIYSDTTYNLKALNLGTDYSYAIESFNENGISEKVYFQK